MSRYRILDLRDGRVDPLGRKVGDDWIMAIITPGLYVTTDHIPGSCVPDLPVDDFPEMLAEMGLADAEPDTQARVVLEMCQRGAAWREAEEGTWLMSPEGQEWRRRVRSAHV